MLSQLLVAELIDHFKRHRSSTPADWQQRNAIARRALCLSPFAETPPCQGGKYFAQTLAFALGKVLGSGKNIIIDGQRGSHALIE
jgi:hypothetical protein